MSGCMKLNGVSNADLPELSFSSSGSAPTIEGQSFDQVLKSASSKYSGQQLMSEAQPIQQQTADSSARQSTPTVSGGVKSSPPNKAKAAAAYRQAMKKSAT